MWDKDLLKEEKDHPEEKQPEKLIEPQGTYYGEAIGLNFLFEEGLD